MGKLPRSLTAVAVKRIAGKKAKLYGASQILDGTEVIAKGKGRFLQRKVNLFFPFVSISSINDITQIRCTSNLPEQWEGKVGPEAFYAKNPYRNFLSDRPGWLVAQGLVNARVDWGKESYFAHVHDKVLYLKRKKQLDDFTKEDEEKMLREAGFNSWEEFHAWELEEKTEPLQNLEKAGRYEEAARGYEKLKMFEKAGELRRMARTRYVIAATFHLGTNGTIDISCPHCNGRQSLKSKSSEVTCDYCNRTYIVPRKLLDML